MLGMLGSEPLDLRRVQRPVRSSARCAAQSRGAILELRHVDPRDARVLNRSSHVDSLPCERRPAQVLEAACTS